MDSFLIFKNKFKKEGSNQPDYKVMAREGDKIVPWGAGWIKDGKEGKYISVQKDKPRPADLKSNHDASEGIPW